MVSEDKIDIMIFLWDPRQPKAHDLDVKALLRIKVPYNVPTACNKSSGDFMIDSVHFQQGYTPILKDYSPYIQRSI